MKVKGIIRPLLLVFRCALFLPHYVVYRNSDKKEIVDEDIKAFLKVEKSKVIIGDYVSAMSDKYFRTIINYRLGKIAKIFTRLYAKDNTFIIDTNCIMGGGKRCAPFCNYHPC